MKEETKEDQIDHELIDQKKKTLWKGSPIKKTVHISSQKAW